MGRTACTQPQCLYKDAFHFLYINKNSSVPTSIRAGRAVEYVEWMSEFGVWSSVKTVNIKTKKHWRTQFRWILQRQFWGWKLDKTEPAKYYVTKYIYNDVHPSFSFITELVANNLKQLQYVPDIWMPASFTVWQGNISQPVRWFLYGTIW
jgi:hypothetical protein